jgi:hypothetical protein
MSLITLTVSPFGCGLLRTAAALSHLPMESPLLALDALQQYLPRLLQERRRTTSDINRDLRSLGMYAA